MAAVLCDPQSPNSDRTPDNVPGITVRKVNCRASRGFLCSELCCLRKRSPDGRPVQQRSTNDVSFKDACSARAVMLAQTVLHTEKSVLFLNFVVGEREGGVVHSLLLGLRCTLA
jgi:hypothetical protein